MSTKYQHSKEVPTEVLIKRLEELSDAVVARMNRDNDKFEREFTCRIPAELDRDADLVLSEASKRLIELEAKTECKVESFDMNTIKADAVREAIRHIFNSLCWDWYKIDAREYISLLEEYADKLERGEL
jgi:hypothetical protein